MEKKDKEEIVGMFEYITEKMATKEYLEKLETKLDSLETKVDEGFSEVHKNISSLRNDLTAVTETAESSKGFATENDFILKEIRAIKKHIGLQTI